MKAVNIFTVGVVGLRPIPGILLLSVCTYVSPSIPSLGGDPDMGARTFKKNVICPEWGKCKYCT